MPFDNSDFALPAVETDAILRELVAARAIIGARGWCQHVTRDDEGRVCSWGALKAVNGDRFYSDSESYLEAEAVNMGFNGYITFNDHPKTTHADVLALFDRAIAARRAEITSKAEQAA